MKRAFALAFATLALGSCAPTPAPAPPAAAPAPPPPAATPAPAPVPVAPPPPPPRDSCGSQEFAGLVGKNKSEIPVPVYPNRFRVACTTCPVTQDFRPDRVNIFYDEGTGTIAEVRCG